MAAVTDLLRVAFVDELSSEVEGALREMRELARPSPLWLLLRLMGLEPRSMLAGFVWEAAGRIVGNVSMTPVDGGRQWLISNVAVMAEHRRQGIARRLMDAALEHIDQQGGEFVSLDVQRQNLAARRLYESLGFTYLDAHAELQAPSLPPPEEVPPGRFRVRDWSPAEGARVYELLISGRSDAAQRWAPISRHRYVTPRPLHWLGRGLQALMAERPIRKLVEADGDLCAMALVSARSLLRRHEGQLMVSQRYAGEVEDLLVAAVLEALMPLAGRPTRFRVLRAVPSLIEALERQGFTVVRILERMGLALAPHHGRAPVRIED